MPTFGPDFLTKGRMHQSGVIQAPLAILKHTQVSLRATLLFHSLGLYGYIFSLSVLIQSQTGPSRTGSEAIPGPASLRMKDHK